jgi:aspartate kinase
VALRSATLSRIKRVAARIKSYHEKGYQLVVVVSAMGHTTDELVDLAAKISTNPPKREMDMLQSLNGRTGFNCTARNGAA